LFDPVKVFEFNHCSNDIDHLKAVSFLSDKLEDLKKDLPSYVAKVDSVLSTINKLEWWHKYTNEPPHWSAVCKLVLLVQPSSAATERVFSLMSNCFFSLDKQTYSLEETIETSVMLQYHSRK